jgi:nucleoid DNA-binding protein
MDVNDLIQRVQERAGISREQAERAVTVFAEFAQEHLNDEQIRSLAQQLPGLGQFADKMPEGMGDKLGGMLRRFGKRDE